MYKEESRALRSTDVLVLSIIAIRARLGQLPEQLWPCLNFNLNIISYKWHWKDLSAPREILEGCLAEHYVVHEVVV